MRKTLCVLLLVFIAVSQWGCLRTRAYIVTEPPGAKVTVNDQIVGYAPVEMNVNWYWFYDFEVEKSGYQDLYHQQKFNPPAYAWFPFDLVVCALPVPILDKRDVVLKMTPIAEEDDRDKLHLPEK